jgi:hypothetical protein
MRWSHRVQTTAFLALAALAGSCDSSNPTGDGQVTIMLTDAPADLLAAVVTVTAVTLSGDHGNVTLLGEPFTTDLLDLAGTTVVLAEDVEVPNDRYHEIRFIITGGYIEVDNGDGTTSIFASSPSYAGLPPGAVVDGDLQLPSFSTSGLKVKLKNALRVDDDHHVVLVDFDAAQSFGHQAGNSGKWVMHPVIVASEMEIAS